MTQDGNLPLESWIGDRLGRWALASARHRGFVAALALALFAASLFVAITRLGIRSETEALFPDDLPFQLRDAAFYEAFPALYENITLVVEGPSAESTRSRTLALAERLRGQPDLFPRVHLAQDPFFEHNGLLYLEIAELEALADRLAQFQPLLAGLVEDESLRGLMNQTRRALEAMREDVVAAVDLALVLARMERTLRGVIDSDTARATPGEGIDWSEIVDWGVLGGDPRRRVMQVQPALDFASLSAAREAILRIRDEAEALGIDDTSGHRLRMTGDMVLNFDEMDLLRRQVSWAGLGSFVVVALLLRMALRSFRPVLATLCSLVCGLVVTAGFATLAIGHLNMISVAFAVLFIGLGVDFGIHLCMRFQELRANGLVPADALRESANGVGSSLLLCAVTTAVGFFAFVPTEFIGVAELGVIAGVGMFIGLIASFSVIPAILIGDRSDAGAERLPPLHLPSWPVHRARTVVAVAGLVAIAAATLIPQLRFDQNPLNVRDPDAESVRVYRDLLADAEHSPWTLEFLALNADEAARIAERFEALPEVASARTIADYVPTDQADKLAIIEEMAWFADWDAIPRRAEPTPAESRASLSHLRDELARAEATVVGDAVAHAARGLEEAIGLFMVTLDSAPPGEADRRLADLEARLLGRFPDLLARLGRAMEAEEVDATAIPVGLREAMIGRNGIHRVEIVPAQDLDRADHLDRFVAAAETVSEALTGPAMQIFASARAVVGALEQALTSAIVVILLFLILLWRRMSDVAMVMLPLVFAGLCTGASMVLTGIPFNFADVIVLPLLLGIGVDSGIHMVHRARIRASHDETLLATSTARAVVFSACTTIASFGTLALVPHQGMANLGQLLVIGVSWTVVANLVLLPALLTLRERSGVAVGDV